MSGIMKSFLFARFGTDGLVSKEGTKYCDVHRDDRESLAGIESR